MFFRTISIWLDGLIAKKSHIPLQMYLEDKKKPLMAKEGLGTEFSDLIQIKKDGAIMVKNNSNPPEKQLPNNRSETEDSYISIQNERIITEIGYLDRRISETEENLQRLRDKEQEAVNQASQLKPLKRDALLGLICFIIISLGEIGAFCFFLGDFLGVDASKFLSEINRNPFGAILLIPLCVGFFGLLLVTASKILKTWKEQKYTECSLYIAILLVTGIGLGIMRALQARKGEIDWAIVLISVVITAGVPIVATVAKRMWREASAKLYEQRVPLNHMQKQIIECVADLSELQRLRVNAETRRQNLIREPELKKQRDAQSLVQRENRVTSATQRVASQLTNYKRVWLWHNRKQGGEKNGF